MGRDGRVEEQADGRTGDGQLHGALPASAEDAALGRLDDIQPDGRLGNVLDGDNHYCLSSLAVLGKHRSLSYGWGFVASGVPVHCTSVITVHCTNGESDD